CFLAILTPPTPTLFPYTTLFRSEGRLDTRSADAFDARSGCDDLKIAGAPGIVKRGVLDIDDAKPRRKIFVANVATERRGGAAGRSEEHTSELQSREISYAVFCLK